MKISNLFFVLAAGWIPVFAFAKGPQKVQACAIPMGLKVTQVSPNSADLVWQTASGQTYALQYKLYDAANWDSVLTATGSAQIANLSSQKTFLVRVVGICSGERSGFSEVVSFTTPVKLQNDTLVKKGATWKYLDNGSNQDTAWRSISFADNAWASGPSKLGYGDNSNATTVGFGPDQNNKYFTTYFRKKIQVPSVQNITGLTLNLVRDDGAVVYFNGKEVLRANMPSGKVGYKTRAAATVSGGDESNWFSFTLPKTHLQDGENQIAVEIHQIDSTSSDIGFNMELIAKKTNPVVTTRSAYLQVVTPESFRIRWQTDRATPSRVRFGKAMAYGTVLNDPTVTQNHEVEVLGLEPNTRYYYSFGSDSVDFGGDAGHYCKTARLKGDPEPFRVWATGDFGVNTVNQRNTRDAMETWCKNKRPDFWVWMGDNVYDTGQEAEYTTKVFDQYPDQMKSIPIYPCLGNHDYGNTGYQSAFALGTGAPYFNIFSTPAQGESGGVPSNSKKYYSFDYGNAHFVVIDSYGSPNAPGSPMYNWLKEDLDSNKLPFTVALFHHPPYSMGTHNSDNSQEDIDMRVRIVPLLESRNVDLVLNGHSHVYERSMLLNGHYGLENTLTSAMKIDSGFGDAQAYTKSVVPASKGTVYAVCGVSGQGGVVTVQPSWPHAAMIRNYNSLYGSMILDFDHDTLDVRFLTSTNSVKDSFMIVKTGITGIWKPKPETIRSLEVFPNPFGNRLSVRFFLDQPSGLEVRILDMTGRTIYEKVSGSTTLAEGRQEMSLDLNQLGSTEGVLVLELKTGAGVVRRLLKREEMR
jgi:hypothetical protein